MTFRKLFDNGAMKLLAIVGVYASTQLGELNSSVQKLNQNVAVLVSQVSEQQRRQDETAGEVKQLWQRQASMEADLAGIRAALKLDPR